MSASETKNRPVREFRYGRLKAAVWRQEGDKGPWYSVSLARSYQDSNGQWQTTQSFGLRDLLEVAKLCNECHSFIAREIAAKRAQVSDDADGSADDEIPH
jgi:hypothetical protein